MGTGLSRARLLQAGALFVAGSAGGSYAAYSLRSPGPLHDAPIAGAEDAGIEAWCAEALTPIAGGGCFAEPPAHDAGPVPLLVYLHGRYAPKTLPDELQRQKRVARMGNARGFAVLAMRGVQGECKVPELADTWCWPSNPRVEADGAQFVARFEPAIAAARARVGAGPTVLLGFSNGAYFATLIATRALRAFDAIAIAHGGPVPPTRAAGARPPVLLITADDDPSDGEMQQLHGELTREHWAHELVAREGGHELPDWDVGMALTFFTRSLKERLPLQPPLQPPHVRAVDAAGGTGVAEDASADIDTPDESDEDASL